MDSREEDGCAFNSDQERSERIRILNDELRRCRRGGQMFITQGVCSLGQDLMPQVVIEVAQFEAFTPDNDPHGEHDFGALEVSGHRIFWKIDYYDHDMEFGSSDPADPSVTTRVLTVMLASEY
ncbi:DUF3768 domain-containing protein [Blastomonas fulva]|uniref:DUF3768 domain-containing protein n=1 Tax=Blastomonas fulva TaxID=1550728 RepID=UPI003D2AF47A